MANEYRDYKAACKVAKRAKRNYSEMYPNSIDIRRASNLRHKQWLDRIIQETWNS